MIQGTDVDKMFEVLLSQGRPAPEFVESHDRKRRVGFEIARPRVRRTVEQLVKDGKLVQEGAISC